MISSSHLLDSLSGYGSKGDKESWPGVQRMVPLVAVRNPEVGEDYEQPMSQGQRCKETVGKSRTECMCVEGGSQLNCLALSAHLY